MSPGQVVGGAFRLLRVVPLVTIGLPIVAVLAVVGTAFAAPRIIDPPGGGLTGLPAVAFGVGVGLLASALASIQAATTFVVLDHAVRGHRIGTAAALSAGLRRAPGLLGVYLAHLLVVVLIVAVGLIPIFLIATLGVRENAVLLAVAGLLPAWGACAYAGYVHVGLITAGPAYVVEGAGVVAALSRARELTHGNWWRTVGTLLLSLVVLYGIQIAGFLVLGLTTLVVTRSWTDATYVIIGVWPLFTALATSFLTGVIGLLHLDQRARIAWS